MPNNVSNTASRKLNYRCFVNQEFEKPVETESLTNDFHLERAEMDEVVIVEDRKRDWVELSNADVDNVGLVNVLNLVSKGQMSLEQCLFTDDQATDLSDINPMDPESVKKTVASQSESEAKLDSIAKQLGVSRDVLINSFIDGTFSNLVAAKTEQPKVEEGDK